MGVFVQIKYVLSLTYNLTLTRFVIGLVYLNYFKAVFCFIWCHSTVVQILAMLFCFFIITSHPPHNLDKCLLGSFIRLSMKERCTKGLIILRQQSMNDWWGMVWISVLILLLALQISLLAVILAVIASLNSGFSSINFLSNSV